MSRIIQLGCPLCSNKRLIDISEGCKAELNPSTDMPPGWEPDFYQKCRICKREIAIKKVS